MTVMLYDLPVDDDRRNKPLEGCFYKYRLSSVKSWKEVKSTFKIASSTYNELGDAWTKYDFWSWEP